MLASAGGCAGAVGCGLGAVGSGLGAVGSRLGAVGSGLGAGVRRVLGLAGALALDAGADVLFVEAPLSEEEIATIAAEVSGPLMLNLVEGGVTPELSIDRISELGYSLALYANLPMLAAIEATRETLRHLRDGSAGPRPRVATWEERQRLVRRDWFGEFELRHSRALPDVLAESDEARS